MPIQHLRLIDANQTRHNGLNLGVAPNIYRAYPVAGGKILAPEIIDVTNDEEALAATEKLVDRDDTEPWYGPRLVKRFNSKASRPP